MILELEITRRGGSNMTNTTIELPNPDQSESLATHPVRMPVVVLRKAIPSDPNLLDEVVAEIIQAIEASGNWDEPDCIDLAVREALANAIIHGNQCNREKSIHIEVALNERRDLCVMVRDSGSGFDPSKIADPTTSENLLAHHGRGLFIMKQIMDKVEVKFDHGTEIHMLRRHKRPK